MDGGDIYRGGELGREEQSLEEDNKFRFKHAVCDLPLAQPAEDV